jgi:hypothetical protein
MVRFAILLLALVVAIPLDAACPLLAVSKPAKSCCHKTSCPRPKPVKTQHCFSCVADVRFTAKAPDHQPIDTIVATVFDVAPVSRPTQVVIAFVPTKDQYDDSSGTYLRNGVLRL